MSVEAPSGASIVLPCGCPAGLVRDVGLHQDGCPRGDLNIVHGPPTAPPFVHTDGGRTGAGFRGLTGDCCARAFATASGRSYREVYDRINELAKRERTGKRKRTVSNARTGVHRVTAHRLAVELGATWTSTMSIGSGTLVHVRADELPATGRLVLNLSKHFAAWIDGSLYDNHDCSRDGTRCVYGYWTFG